MAKLQATVNGVQVEQERNGVVLRLVLQMESGEKVPVEMRGYEVRGVLQVGDQIHIEGRKLRDRDGVARPREVINLSSNSKVTVRRAGVIRRFFSFLFSLIISVASGVATSVLVSLILDSVSKSGSLSSSPRLKVPVSPSHSAELPILPILVGLGVTLVVFLYHLSAKTCSVMVAG